MPTLDPNYTYPGIVNPPGIPGIPPNETKVTYNENPGSSVGWHPLTPYGDGPGVTPSPNSPGPNPVPNVNQENQFTLPENVYPYSGLPESYRDQLLSFVMPNLQRSVTDLPGNIDQFTNQAMGGYRQELDNALKQMIPQQINQLANRGVLDSSVASDTLSRTASQAATQSATKGYQTAMEAARMKTQIPNTLAGILQMGQSSQDPTVMYRTMASLLASL